MLFLSRPEQAPAETCLHYKWQDYGEEDGRIQVRAQYLRAEVNLGPATRLTAQGIEDVITGATPTGQPPPPGSEQVPLSTLTDTRYAATVAVGRVVGAANVGVEYAHSDEHDYISDGYSGTWVHEFNQRNTQLQVGFSYIDDRISPVFFTEARRKISRDLLVGVSQVLGPNTTITANLTRGQASGYLSDPYKIVQKNIELLPGLPLPLTFAEHRPDERTKTIVHVSVMRYLEGLRAGCEASGRYFRDDHGVESGTFELAWHQKIGGRVVVRPGFRFYRQSPADYYYPNLDDTDIIPVPNPGPSTPHYSSDYRLARFDATTVGLKFVYSHDERWSLDALFERYTMHGRDDTAASAFIRADSVTLGLRLCF